MTHIFVSYHRDDSGGSWSNPNSDYFRAAFRFRYNPDYRFYGIWFRLASSLIL